MTRRLRSLVCGLLAGGLVETGPVHEALAAGAPAPDAELAASPTPTDTGRSGGAVTRIVIPPASERRETPPSMEVDEPAPADAELPEAPTPASGAADADRGEDPAPTRGVDPAHAGNSVDAGVAAARVREREIVLGGDEQAGWAPEGVRVETPSSVAPAVDPANYRTVLVGNVITAIGGATFITMIVGLVLFSSAGDEVDRARIKVEPDPDAIDEAIRKRTVGLGLFLGGAAASLVCFSSGVALIATGRKRERIRRANLSADLPTPAADRHGVGLSWGLRF